MTEVKTKKAKSIEPVTEYTIDNNIEVEPNKEIGAIIQANHLKQETSLQIHSSFDIITRELDKWADKASSIKVVDVSQKKEMQEAREVRLALKDIRVKSKHKMEELTEDSKNYIKAVRDVYKYVETKCSPLESNLQKAEDFEKNFIAEQEAKWKLERTSEMSAYFHAAPYPFPLEKLTEAQYAEVKEKARVEHENVKQKIEIAEKLKVRVRELNTKNLFQYEDIDTDSLGSMPDEEYNLLLIRLTGLAEQAKEKERAREAELAAARAAIQAPPVPSTQVQIPVMQPQQDTTSPVVQPTETPEEIAQREAALKQSQQLLDNLFASTAHTAINAPVIPLATPFADMPSISNQVLEDEQKLRKVKVTLLELRSTCYNSDKYKELGTTVNNAIDILLTRISQYV